MNRDISHLIRCWLVGLFFLACALVIVGRVTFLHVFNKDFLQEQGDARTIRNVKVMAHRGMIMDRYHKPLAVSTPIQSLWVNPKEFDTTHPNLTTFAQLLAVKSSKLREKIVGQKHRNFLYLKRQVVPSVVAKIDSLDLPGVYFQSEYKRYYPSSEVAAHVVGLTNIDDNGIEGIELAYNEWLSGTPGLKKVVRNRLGETVETIASLQQAESGKNLVLSLDKHLQYLCYRKLKAAVQKHHAKSGSAVMLDVQTGEVLAMVNQPSFNPNNRKMRLATHARNRAVTDVFEPGSTVKPFAVASALGAGVFDVNEKINTHPGWVNVSGKMIKDIRNYGLIDLRTVMQKSSNVGMSKIALSLAMNDLKDTFYKVGFGQITGSGFPGESTGMLPEYNRNSPITRASLSFGYGLSVTPLQLAQSYLVLANAGMLKPISFAKVDSAPRGMRVLPRHAAEAVLDMLTAVVTPEGTGHLAQVEGYQVAGKTGTARLVGDNGYKEDSYVSLFAGVAPASQPRVALVIAINDPRGEEYYGGRVAAPVFAEVVSETMRLLNVRPDSVTNPQIQLAKIGEKQS